MGIGLSEDFIKNRKNPLFKGDDRRVFNFRNNDVHILPEEHDKLQKDIGWSLLTHVDGLGLTSTTYLLRDFQKITINEFLQETKIDTILDALKNVSSGWDSAMKLMDQIREENAGEKANYIGRVLTSRSFLEGITRAGTIDNIKDTYELYDNSISVLKMTYALQCRLMKKHNSACYVLPYNSNQLYVSNGTDGWPTIESSVSHIANTHSILGKLVNFIGSQIRITTEPIWTGISQQSQTTINIKLNLFNDTLDKAVDNFKFINNIIPNNTFLQYGILQAPPAYYDVRIEGNRCFPLCAGQFSCNGKGMMRRVPKTILQTLKGQYEFNKVFGNGDHEFIVPDVYELDLTFKPLLPDTFNNFLYYMMTKDGEMVTQEGSVLGADYLQKATEVLNEVDLQDESIYMEATDEDINKFYDSKVILGK